MCPGPKSKLLKVSRNGYKRKMAGTKGKGCSCGCSLMGPKPKKPMTKKPKARTHRAPTKSSTKRKNK